MAAREPAVALGPLAGGSMTGTPGEFAGIPAAALDFYDDLEADNTRSFWAAHKEVYETAIRAPMAALAAALAEEFGPAKLFRPYRDVRFAKDKSPYKTHQGVFVPHGSATGWYVEVAAPGVLVGAGFHEVSTGQLARLRDAIADDRRGGRLVEIVEVLQAGGWTLGGERLKSAPRGYSADHPRIDLLRHKSMRVVKSYGFEPVIHTPALLGRVRMEWRQAAPFVEWVTEAVGGE